ncbi:UNVERIFIED_ORG: hypothetical protein QQG_1717 [Clostridioides difficile Y384]|nr:hypothetical protein QAO_1485 [Clostridioides difficile CD3]EQG29735.1 hypothetical protein QIK_1537 [Clostridioides difficile DA00126]EQG65678.1 hypothetical protein QK1_1605 [Clostridioides difficile DA00142]EQG76055.1 hypothetical protein QKA_1589 [Clostridioides difficile DA00165]EQG93926.1 hypothetical protein QKK_1637 [Clostridioides difficile DA00191]EQH00141.1 hypothetical protein QKO_3783 [Clostridioides difficile DA00195]EQH09180.1 hypothetical protein QKS_1478 [Clostridioides di
MPCFILTIWNVNFKIKYICLPSTEGFILTIWNVNLQEDASLSDISTSFILTIWNVNYVKNKINKSNTL